MLQLLSLLLFTLPSTPSESPIRVPHTSAGVMIDGVLAKAEWQNAARVDVPGIAESCIFSALVSLFTLQSNIPRLLLALLICISTLREERFTISTHLPNSEN